ncbi:hypothetical protein MUK42_35288 [Musa troglodytarum]|uniref:Uncharacterized protein n=1 Tax=Musa troglodytarum TaxID=320322 RepID=A0A9E7I7N0_9LILI|nr:hypothetical protein MUK42_35288 [Musa troglodytarum]
MGRTFRNFGTISLAPRKPKSGNVKEHLVLAVERAEKATKKKMQQLSTRPEMRSEELWFLNGLWRWRQVLIE